MTRSNRQVDHEDLLTTIKRCKLQWYGHVSRSSGLTKTILRGKVKGGRRRSGQRKRWEDNIREWTGLEFGKSQRAVENREKWRKPVAKSSVVPQLSSRLKKIDDDDDDNDDGLPQTYSKQAAQNVAARTVTKYKKTDHITPIL